MRRRSGRRQRGSVGAGGDGCALEELRHKGHDVGRRHDVPYSVAREHHEQISAQPRGAAHLGLSGDRLLGGGQVGDALVPKVAEGARERKVSVHAPVDDEAARLQDALPLGRRLGLVVARERQRHARAAKHCARVTQVGHRERALCDEQRHQGGATRPRGSATRAQVCVHLSHRLGELLSDLPRLVVFGRALHQQRDVLQPPRQLVGAPPRTEAAPMTVEHGEAAERWCEQL